MSRGDVVSIMWLVVVLAGAAAVSGAFVRGSPELEASAGEAAGDTRGFVRDAMGRDVPIRAYRRIASASVLADGLLVELAEPERIVAFSQRGMTQHPERHRFGGRMAISGLADLERLIAERVDLLLVNHGAASEVERARGAGIAVFDLGEMRGMATLEGNVRSLARLLGDANRGERLWARFVRRMRAVASDIPAHERKRAIYLALYAGKVFGGTRGTSYHDVLEAAGLTDIAADSFRDWPQYDPEQLLALDPPWVVTDQGMARELCANRWLAAMAACREPSRVIELPSALIGDPGLAMLDAAERLRDAAYSRLR